MKNTYIFAFCLILIGSEVLAQSQEDFDALATFLPSEILQDLEENDNLQYRQIAYLNKKGYHLSSFESKSADQEIIPLASIVKKYESLPDLSFNLIESGELNLLGYSFVIYPDRYNYYSIDGSSQVLVIPPGKLSLKRASLSNN